MFFEVRFLAAVALVVLSAGAWADYYQCQDDGGEYWQTSPCPPGEEHPDSAVKNSDKPIRAITDDDRADAKVRCAVAVENLARYNFKWVDGFWGNRWPHVTDVKAGVLLQGDSIEIQNGFGNYIRHKYRCLYDPDTKKAIADAEPGRL